MVPTFVIGLREGLEAALIVGIVAAFLRQRGRSDLLRLALLGVFAALALCVAGGVALEVLSQNLPQRQQEGLETVVGTIAVGMVTYMVVWMRRNSRNLKTILEGAASDAVASGSGMALVLMAFLAVLREGFETVVFLLAAFNESNSGTDAGIGAVLGILLASTLGYGIYRGGVRINLAKFFRVTGAVLVVVAAGLVVSALHTAHEAGWLNVGQQQTINLTPLTRPGSVQSSLITGVLGIQDRPTLVELLGWLAYLIPLMAYVLWPADRSLSRTRLSLSAAVMAVGSTAAAISLGLTAPHPGTTPALSTAAETVAVDQHGNLIVAARSVGATIGSATAATSDVPVGHYFAGQAEEQHHLELDADRYATTAVVPAGASLPASVTLAQAAALNGGRLPLGAVPAASSSAQTVRLRYVSTLTVTWWVEPRTGALIDVSWLRSQRTSATFAASSQAFELGSPSISTGAVPAAVSATAAQRTRAVVAALAAQQRHRDLAETFAISAVAFLILAVGVLPRRRRLGKREDLTRTPATSGLATVEANSAYSPVHNSRQMS